MSKRPEPAFAAILAAGGTGTRFSAGSEVSRGTTFNTGIGCDTASERRAPAKQFQILHGHPMYVWSLLILLDSPQITQLIIVAPADMVAGIIEQIEPFMKSYPDKVLRVVAGGGTRQESVYIGLQALEKTVPDYVLVHDAARPFLTAEIVSRAQTGAIKHGACTTGIRPADTIKTVYGEMIAQTLDRQSMLLVQTPQAARFDLLINAHRLAREKNFATTDDAAVLEFAGHQVAIVNGANFNIKVTQPEDLILAEALASIVFKDRL